MIKNAIRKPDAKSMKRKISGAILVSLGLGFFWQALAGTAGELPRGGPRATPKPRVLAKLSVGKGCKVSKNVMRSGLTKVPSWHVTPN